LWVVASSSFRLEQHTRRSAISALRSASNSFVRVRDSLYWSS
jgi:hypothetical protein